MDQPGTECDWYGIVCDSPYHAAKSPAFVVSLELSENNLVGPIPPELQKLQSLEWLSLWGNQLKGKWPEPCFTLTRGPSSHLRGSTPTNRHIEN